MAKNRLRLLIGHLAPRASVALSAIAVVAAVAYFFWLSPSSSPAPDARPDAKSAAESKGGPAKKGDGKGRAAAAPVTAAAVVEADMPVILMAPGTVEPLANVAVRTRVDGQIVEVAFNEGDLVTDSSVLF